MTYLCIILSATKELSNFRNFSLVSNLSFCFTGRIGPLYVISGIGGSLLSGLFIESTISVGASGALFGLLGAMLSELIANWTIYANKVLQKLCLPSDIKSGCLNFFFPAYMIISNGFLWMSVCSIADPCAHHCN